MSNNEDYNPFSNTHNPNSGSDSSQSFTASSAPFYSSAPTESDSNPYSAPSPYAAPTEPSPYGPPTGASGNPYASSGSAPAYQGPLNNPGHPYGGYGYNAGNMAQGTNPNATAALILGIVGLTLLPFIGSLVAVILGHSAKKQIRASGQDGSGSATAGLIMGWIGLAFSVFGALLFIGMISTAVMS